MRSEGLRVMRSVAFAAALLAVAPTASAQSAPEPAAAPAAPMAPAPADAAAAPPAEQATPEPHAPPPARFGKPTTPGEQPRKVGVLLRLDFDFGGDRVWTATWSDGNTKDIKAGQLFTISGGLYYHPDAPYAVEATLGYKSDGAEGANGNITFWRVPFDLVASFAPGRHRIGVGPTVHFSPTFGCNADGACGFGTWEVKYDTAIGGIVQYAYGYPLSRNSGVEVAVRYTAIQYKGSAFNIAGLPETVNGSGAGFLVGAWF